ncbi:MAG: tetratricopeptide repeat protein [Chloroflexota bacterium]
MAQEKEANEVFISYARGNGTFVQHFVDALKEKGVDPWFDMEDLPKSAEWWNEICKGIEGANAYVFVISPESLTSMVCNWELDYAITLNKKILPVVYKNVLGNLELQAQLKALEWKNPQEKTVAASKNWERIRQINFIFLQKENRTTAGEIEETDNLVDAVPQVIDAIRMDLDYVELHTRLLQRALQWQRNDNQGSYLLNGAELRRAEDWLNRGLQKEPPPAELHGTYLSASRTAQRRSQRRLLSGVSIALIITAALALLSFGLFRQSESNLSLAQVRGTEVAHQAGTATNALGISQVRGTEVSHQAATATVALGQADINLKEAWNSQSLQLADYSAQELLQHSPRSALALAVESVAHYPDVQNFESVAALRNALDFPWANVLHLRHTISVNGAHWSPDEKYVVSWTNTNIMQEHEFVLHLWNSEAGAEIQAIHHPAPIYGAEISPDDSRVVSWSNGSFLQIHWTALQVWDIATGQEDYAVYRPVERASWSPDGTYLAYSTSDALHILNAADGTEVGKIEDSVVRWQWSPDSASIFTPDTDTPQVWTPSGLPISSVPESVVSVLTSSRRVEWHDSAITIHDADGSVLSTLQADSPDTPDETIKDVQLNKAGDYLYITRYDNENEGGCINPSLEIWMKNGVGAWGKFVQKPFYDYACITALQWSHDGERLLVGSGIEFTFGTDKYLPEGLVDIWDVHGAFDSVLTIPDTKQVFAVQGQQLLRQNSQNPAVVDLFDLNGLQVTATFVHDKDALGAIFNTDGSQVLTWSADGTARLWDAQTGKELARFQHQAQVNFAKWNDDNSIIYTGSDDGHLKIWDAHTGALVKDLESSGQVRGLLWTKDNSTPVSWATQSGKSELTVWSASGDLVAQVAVDSDFQYRNPVLAPDQKKLIINDGLNLFRLDLQTLDSVQVFDGSSSLGNLIGYYTLAPDGKHFAAVIKRQNTGFGTEVYSVSDGNLEFRLDYDSATECHCSLIPGSIRWSNDGRQLLTIGENNQNAIWDIQDGKLLVGWTTDGNQPSYDQTGWSNDEKYAYALSGSTLKLWILSPSDLLQNNKHPILPLTPFERAKFFLPEDSARVAAATPEPAIQGNDPELVVQSLVNQKVIAERTGALYEQFSIPRTVDTSMNGSQPDFFALPYHNFVAGFDVVWDPASYDDCGIAARYSATIGGNYKIVLSSQFGLTFTEERNQIPNYVFSSSINLAGITSPTIHLIVVGVENRFTLFANGAYVGSFRGGLHEAGRIGLWAQHQRGVAKCTFNSGWVWNLDASGPMPDDRAHFVDAENAISQQGDAAAIALFTQAIDLNPQYGDAFYQRGYLHFFGRERDLALQDFSSAIQFGTTDVLMAYLFRAGIYEGQGTLESAINDYSELIRLAPQPAQYLGYRADLYNKLNQPEKALADYDEAIKLEPNAFRYGQRGWSYHLLGKDDLAIQDLTQAILIDPTFAQAYENRGDIYQQQGQYDDSVADYSEAIKLKPNADRYNGRGWSYDLLGKYDLAMQDYTQAIQNNPGYVKAYENRGHLYQQQGQYDDSVADYSEAIKLEPNADRYNGRGWSYYLLGKYDLAIPDFTQALALDTDNPSDEASFLSNRGDAYRRTEQYDKAIADYTQSISLRPTARRYNLRGISYAGLQQYDQAILDFTQAIDLNTDNPADEASFLSGRADVYRRSGQYEAATTDFTAAIDLQPTARRYNARGVSYIGLQQYDLAISDFTQAINLNTDNPADEASFLSGRADAYRRSGQYEAAITDYTATIDLQPTPSRYNSRGLSYTGLQQYDKAIADYTQAIDLNTDNPSDEALFLSNRGDAYRRSEEYEAAVTDYTGAIDLQPTTRRYNVRGVSYARLQQYDKAIADFTQALDLNTDNPSDEALFLSNRGDGYWKSEQYDQAIRDYSGAIDLQPTPSRYNVRGISYAALEKYDQAIADFTQAIDLNTDNLTDEVLFLRNRGAAYRMTNHIEAANKDDAQATELESSARQ